MPPIMPPFYFVTQKLRGSSLSFPKATCVAKISSIDNFIADNEIPTRNNPTRVFHCLRFKRNDDNQKYFSSDRLPSLRGVVNLRPSI